MMSPEYRVMTVVANSTSCGTENSATHGYHETITRFYMGVISTYLTFASPQSDWLALTNRFIEQFGELRISRILHGGG